MTGEEVAQQLNEEYFKSYNYVKIRCYNTQFHNNGDSDPSLVIYDEDRGYYCFACGVSGSHEWLMKQFGIEGRRKYVKRAPKPKQYKQYDFKAIESKLDPLSKEYVNTMQNSKGIHAKVLNKLGWATHNNQVSGWGIGMYIPYRFEGRTVAARIRLPNGPIRFKSLPGGESFPYMLDNAKKPLCYVCEGETDAITMSMNGFPAVGIPGATNSQAIRKLVAVAKEYNTTLCIVPDDDKAGRDFFERVMNMAAKEDLRIDRLGVRRGKDANEWYQLSGAEQFKKEVKEGREEVIR